METTGIGRVQRNVSPGDHVFLSPIRVRSQSGQKLNERDLHNGSLRDSDAITEAHKLRRNGRVSHCVSRVFSVQ